MTALDEFKGLTQGVTKRCRLSFLTNSALVIRVQMRGERGSSGVSANEFSCAHHVTWSQNKLWRSTSIFNLWPNSTLQYSLQTDTNNTLTELVFIMRLRTYKFGIFLSYNLINFQGGAPEKVYHGAAQIDPLSGVCDSQQSFSDYACQPE